MKNKENNQGSSLPWFVPVGIILMILWGLVGLITGDGFFGGIGKQFDAIGELISLGLKLGAVILILWLIFNYLNNKDKKGS